MPTTCYTPASLLAGTAELTFSDHGPIMGSNEYRPSPAPSGKVTSMRVTLSVTQDLAGAADCVFVGVSRDDALYPLEGSTVPGPSGTWSGGINGGYGIYRSSQVQGWYSDDFADWLTDYVSIPTGGASANIGTVGPASLTKVPEFEVIVKCRHSNWAGDFGFICGKSGNLFSLANGWALWLDGAGGLNFRFRNNVTGSQQTLYATTAAMGCVDGQWRWFRVRLTAADGVQMWASADGSSWSLVASASTSGGRFDHTSPYGWGDATLFIGCTFTNGIGFGGDIADLRIYDAGGTKISDLSLANAPSSSATSWASNVPGETVNRSPIWTAVGHFAGTQEFEFTFDEPWPVDDFRLIVERTGLGGGQLRVDEWCLTTKRRGGTSIGRLKAMA